jgi:signal transduction histidine kinase
MTDVFPGIEKTNFFRTYQQVLRTGKPDVISNSFAFPDGRKSWYEVRVYPIEEGLFIIANDIPERKKIEEEQSRLQRRLEAQWEIARMVDADIKTITDYVLEEIVSLTKSSYGFYGFMKKDEQVMEIHSWSKGVMKDCEIDKKPLVFPIEKSGVWGNAIRNRKTLIINNYKKSYPNKKGLPKGHVSINNLMVIPIVRKKRIVSVGAVANKNSDYTKKDSEQMIAFLQSSQIIQDKRLAEEELNHNRENLEKLVNFRTEELKAAIDLLNDEIQEKRQIEEDLKLVALFAELNPSPVLRFDVKGRVNSANPAARILFGPGTLTGKSLSSLIPGIKHFDLVTCIREGIILSHSAQIRKRSFHFLIRGISDMNVGHVYSSDITKLEHAKAESIRASHLASLGELAAGVAHEINNPINGIINYSQLLKNTLKPKSKEHEITGRIIKEGNRIAVIVKNLLTFVRDDQNSKEPVRVKDLIFETLALIETQLKKDGVMLKVDIPEDLPDIIASPNQIEQVFLNIISNARHALNDKYSGSRGDKILKILGETMTSGRNTYVRTTFYDTGPGIASDIMDKVFLPFYTTKNPETGTGLGLSISHGIIRDHGGKIRINSAEGEFTRLIIDLPVPRKKKRDA